MILRFGIAAVVVLLCAASGQAGEAGSGRSKWWDSDSFWPEMEWRDDWEEEGVTIDGYFDAYFFGNPVGGAAQGFAYNHSLYFQLEADLGKLAGWEGGSFVLSWADNAGSNLSDTIVNEFQVVGAYGPNTFYFDLLYLQQEVEIGDTTLTVQVGQLTALSEFLATDLGNYYVNEAFQADVLRGIDVLATYEPESSWGAWAKIEQPAWYVQSGIYQVSARIGDNSTHGLDYSIQPDDGLIVFLEGCWQPQWRGTEGLYPSHYKAGAFVSSWEYPRYAGGEESIVSGFYALADQMVWREEAAGDEGLYAWANVIYAPQEQVAQIPWFVAGGVQYLGLLRGRGADRAVLGVAYGAFSMDQATMQKAEDVPPQRYELAVEVSYWIAVNDWMSITPDVQLIVNPGGANDAPDALVIGMMLQVTF